MIRYSVHACSLANTRGSFLVFGVSERGQGVDRVTGIPRSTENQKELADKLQRSEPPLRFEVLNPQIRVDDLHVLLVVEVAEGSSGPHWYRGRNGAREFWKRSEGRSE